MRITYISDLHLEFGDLTLPGGEVLILAGDVCEARHLQHPYDSQGITFAFENRHKRPDRYIRFFIEECAKYDCVFYVMGNHEHYSGRFDQTAEIIRGLLPANVHLLENQTVEYGGVQFMGATMWTDLNRSDPITEYTVKDVMNDYRVIKNYYRDQGQFYKLTPAETLRTHKRTIEYFRQTLKDNSAEPFVVITHHAPSHASVGDEFKNDYHVNGAYASNLSNFILDNPNIHLWFHGHMHHKTDYMIGQCHVLTNPRGYVGYERQANSFDPGLTIEFNPVQP